MKRSPIVEDATDSVNCYSEDNQQPEYEWTVLKMEGISDDDQSSQPRKKLKKRHKKKVLDFDPPTQTIPAKRIKLIFDNESRIINVPHS